MGQTIDSATFRSELFTVNSRIIALLPKEASAKLPSRGQVLVKGTIDGVAFQAPLEPDGRGSHWLHVDAALQKATGLKSGDTPTLIITPAKEWPEPIVPLDIQKGVADNPKTQDLWRDITPLARWEWIRWIRATNQSETRSRRIETARSKLLAGERRPCCFNRAMCCVPEVSKSGVLLGPDQ